MHLAALLDLSIFTGYETFIGEMKPDFIGCLGAGIVAESRAATFTIDEMTVVVLPIRPQSRNPACFAMLPATAPDRSGRQHRVAQ
jgi:hypothetical protein